MRITVQLLLYLLSFEYECRIINDRLKPRELTLPMVLDEYSNGNICSNLLVTSADRAILGKIQKEVVLIIPFSAEDRISDITNTCILLNTDEDLHTIMFRVSQIMFRLKEWDLLMKQDLLDSANLNILLNDMHQLIPYPIAIVDRYYVVHAYTKDCMEQRIFDNYASLSYNRLKTPQEVVSDLLLQNNFVESFSMRNPFVFYHGSSPNLCYNVFEKEQFLTRLLVTIPEPYPFLEGLMELFVHCAQYIQTAFFAYTDDVIVKRQHDQIHQLLANNIQHREVYSSQQIIDVIGRFGWKEDHQYELYAVQFRNVETFHHIAIYICNQLEIEWEHSCAISADNEILWVVNDSLCPKNVRGYSRRQCLAYMIRDFVCKAGVSSGAGEVERLFRDLYQQARFALQAGQKRDPDFWYYKFSDYIPTYLIEGIEPQINQMNLWHKGIQKIQVHDQKSSVKLMPVLVGYLTSGYNASQAAEKLYMHRSTFNRQMQKIQAITGLDWSKGLSLEEQIHILLSLHLVRE